MPPLVITTCGVLVLLCLSGRTLGFRWLERLRDGSTLEVCDGNDVFFPWSYQLNAGEGYSGAFFRRKRKYGDAPELTDANPQLAKFEYGNARFRFAHMPEVSLAVHNARINDTGAYAVWINIVSGDLIYQYKNQVSLLVKEEPVVSVDSLNIRLLPDVVKVDEKDGTWEHHIRLSCGHFEYLGHPAVTVTWTTPSSVELPSTYFSDGTFYLHVPNPVENGLYSCNIKDDEKAMDCLPFRSRIGQSVTVNVPGLEMRVRLLEERMRFREHQDLRTIRVMRPANTVAFTATLTSDVDHGSHATVIFDNVLQNTGEGYNGSSGVFTAPRGGHYAFLVVASTRDNYRSLQLVKNGNSLVSSGNSTGQVTVGGVFHVRATDQVLVQQNSDSGALLGSVSTFSGHLLH